MFKFLFSILSLTLLFSSPAFSLTKYNYKWDKYGLCGRYHPDTGAFSGHSHFYCDPDELNPTAEGASMNRVYQEKGSKQQKCGEFTSGGFFVREKDSAWLDKLMVTLGDSIRENYRKALADPKLGPGLKKHVKSDGTPSVIAFYCALRKGIPGGRGKQKVVGIPTLIKRPIVKEGKHKGQCGYWRYKKGVKEKFTGFFKREKYQFVALKSFHCD
jgi:hypothetical protein